MGLKENIKFYRNKCDLTLEEVAKILGISKPTLQRYESGVISNIPYDKIEGLAEIFGITPAQLMGWDELEKEIQADIIFENFLKSMGYKITVEKADESITGHCEEMKDEDGNVFEEVWVADKETATITVSKNGFSVGFSEEGFKKFKQNIEKSVEFEIYKANQNK